jgi:hypothetical protein
MSLTVLSPWLFSMEEFSKFNRVSELEGYQLYMYPAINPVLPLGRLLFTEASLVVILCSRLPESFTSSTIEFYLLSLLCFLQYRLNFIYSACSVILCSRLPSDQDLPAACAVLIQTDTSNFEWRRANWTKETTESHNLVN